MCHSKHPLPLHQTMNMLPVIPPLLSIHLFLCFSYLSLSSPLRLHQPTHSLQHKADKLALLAFKSSITDDPYDSLHSWNESSHYCRWGGITCGHRHGSRVVAIGFESVDLVGSLSPSLGNLTFLKILHLPYNKFHGVIPAELGRLFLMEYLNLTSNALHGKIPTALLANCVRLVVVDMVNNSLSGNIPSRLGPLLGLRGLWLSDNNLTGAIPSSLGKLTSLVELDLSRNNLTGSIPGSLGQLPLLEELDLSSNKLAGTIPPSLGNLSFLTYLSLFDNHIVGAIPQQFFKNLTSLVVLDFSMNGLSGAIPSSVWDLSFLVELDLSDNDLSGTIPPPHMTHSHLQYLNMSYNRLTGTIPYLLGEYPSLAQVDLFRNAIGGVIPPSFANLTSVVSVDLSENRLEGELPEHIGRLGKLEVILLGQNVLSGSIPPSFYNLSSLRRIGLMDNHFSGTLPSNLGNTLPNLGVLNINKNKFGGPIPASLSNASGLQRLDLGSNMFTGQVPANLGGWKDLTWFSIQKNQIQAEGVDGWGFLTSLTNCTLLEQMSLVDNSLGGLLPASIGNLSTQLKQLWMGRNRISGSIPSGIGKLVGLNLLAMDSNLFTGEIPDSVGEHLGGLRVLSLNSNILSGRIPSSLGNLTLLNELYLDKNGLQGRIPPSLGACQNLDKLDLSYNDLSGAIPQQVIIGLSWLSGYLDLSHNLLTGNLPVESGQLTNMGELNIIGNRLSGAVPSTLGACKHLEYLYMGNNQFQGGIPSSLANLKGLRELDLSSNNLSGPFPAFLSELHSLEFLNLSFNNELEGPVPVEGIFGNASAVSLLGENKLCGGITELHLPSCELRMNGSRRGRLIAKTIIVAVVLGVVVLAILLLCFFFKRKRKNPLPSSSSHDEYDRYKRISYSELLKATNGFSSENLIGTGRFGSVYKGMILDSDGSTLVAIKVLNLQERGATKSFMAECEVLRNLRHRNLVRIITSCSSLDYRGNDFKAIIFELMPNGSLEDWLHPKTDEDQMSHWMKLSLIERLNIAIDVASALVYLHNHHEKPIVHCDLKPSNVLIDNDMCAHVSDFGLAMFISLPNNQTSQHGSSSIAIRGTVGYIPPEYGMGGKASTQGDVYSYGIMLLELLTAKSPTSHMFQGGMTLPVFASGCVTSIADPFLLQHDDGDINEMNQASRRAATERCIASVVALGLSCSKELPRDRMDMEEVLKQLHAIRDAFCKPQPLGDIV